MPFERFERHNMPMPDAEPFVSLQKRGPFSLNRVAFEMLGSPEAVELLFDKEANVVGLQPVSPGGAYSYPVRPQGRPNSRPSNYLIAGEAFRKHYGLDMSATRRYPATLREDGILEVDLGQEGVEVIGNRAKSRNR